MGFLTRLATQAKSAADKARANAEKDKAQAVFAQVCAGPGVFQAYHFFGFIYKLGLFSERLEHVWLTLPFAVVCRVSRRSSSHSSAGYNERPLVAGAMRCARTPDVQLLIYIRYKLFKYVLRTSIIQMNL